MVNLAVLIILAVLMIGVVVSLKVIVNLDRRINEIQDKLDLYVALRNARKAREGQS